MFFVLFTKKKTISGLWQKFFSSFGMEVIEESDPGESIEIEIHFESIRTIPVHSDICIRANANHSEPIRKTAKNQSELIWLIPRHQSEWTRTNPKSSFQSRSIRINPNHPTLDSFRLILIGNSVWIDPSSDWCVLKTWFWIGSDSCFGINWIKSDWFLTVFHQTSYKTVFGLVRNDSHWLGYRYQNESE